MDWLADDDDLDDSLNLPAIDSGSFHLSDRYHPLRDDNNAPENAVDKASAMPTQEHHASSGYRLIPTSVLPDAFRQLFKFGVFNAMQSQVFNAVMETAANLVICAPTGSGKTVLFELGIVRLLKTEQQERKCVYMAPTKALCSERCRDWTEKFSALGIKCCELTGDTVEFNSNALGEARQSTIILLFSITTPEKFDSLSRNWRDNCDFISQIGLFLIDEVHILNDTRGSTLEVVISRMKSRASLRFIVVSATVPNINDVAEWVGNECSTGPATVFTFGEQYRPCRLSRFIYGFPRKNQNEFSFDRSLDYRLLPLLLAHADNKPSLIFCSTRKGTVATAETLMKEYVKLLETKQCVPWVKPRCLDTLFADQKLQELASYGIGVHHAGLGLEDRRLMEQLFLKKIIQVVVATSTLAVGVNLPHTVVIKGVKTWQNGEWCDYSELDFIQMIGRAGRPQFDKEGVAIVLCDTEQEKKFKAIATQQICLESCLHHNLVEHVNSEIGLGTITNLSTAKEWLHNSFLFHRIQKNPRHYALNKSSSQTWENRLDELVETSISDLQESKLITVTGNDEYKTTEYGDIMSKFYIRLNTMKAIINLPDTANVREILQTISNAEELSELRLRSGEKQAYRKLAEHKDIRFPSKVEKAADKVFILIQAVLGGVPLGAPEYKTSDSQPFLEAITILKHSIRVARTIVEVALVKKQGLVLKSGMELLRSLTGKAWEDRPIVLRQIEHIGEKSIRVLAQNNITTLAALRTTTPSRLELILNRRPPFGTQILTAVSELPQYHLDITDSCIQPSRKNRAIMVELTVKCRLNEDHGETGKSSKRKFAMLGMTSILTLTNEFGFIDFRRIPTRALRQPKVFSVTVVFEKPSQFVVITISPDNFAGLSVTTTYKPSISAEEYPVPQTKPLGYDVDEILAGLEDDPTFWQTAIDSDEVPEPTEKTSAAERNNERSKQFSNLGKTSTTPAKLPNGNYRCNHTCKRKNQCRHLCCRDGLSRPPRRNSVSCPQGSTQASKSRPQCKKPAALNSQNNGGTLFPKSAAAAKPPASSTVSLLPTEKWPVTRKKGETTEYIRSDSEKITSSDDESLPHVDEFFKHFGEICDEDVIVVDDSESQSQLMIKDDTTEGATILSGQSKKRKSPVVTMPRQLKRQKLDGLSPNSPAVSFNGEEAIHPTLLFLPSSSLDRNEPDSAIVSQTFALNSGIDACSQFANEKLNEKEQLDDDERNRPLDGYARDYAELCAWLMDVAE